MRHTMRTTVLSVLLLGCLLLSGCHTLMERSYHTVTPHIQFSDEDTNPSILRAETYQGLVSALLHLVGQCKESGVIRLYQYASLTGSASSDVDRACLEVTQEDPLGAYAVDYIKYNVTQTAAYYEVTVSLTYTKTPEELAQVISVTGSTAIAQELRELLPQQPEQVVFRISHFTRADSTETVRQAVLDAYYESQTKTPLPPLVEVQVTLYPNQGQQRVAEILLTWGTSTQTEGS